MLTIFKQPDVEGQRMNSYNIFYTHNQNIQGNLRS